LPDEPALGAGDVRTAERADDIRNASLSKRITLKDKTMTRSLLFLFFLSTTASAADWPQHLGPERNGISAEKGLLDAWPASGPKEVWRERGGVGMSALAISKGTLFTLVQKDGKQWLVAHHAATGKLTWEKPLAPEYKNAMGDGPRAAPAVAGDLVFTFTGEGILTASKVTDGSALWSHNCVKELKGKVAEYGMASSPLVVDDQVIVTVGAPQATVAAYETKTGKLAWTAGSDPAGYSSPALLNVGGRKQIVVYTGGSALGLEPASGKQLWRYPYETNFDCNIATPLAIKGQVFISSGENHGSALLALKPKSDAFTVEEVWTSQGTKSVLRNEWQTSILLDGYLYGMDNVGGAGPITHLTCINAATGERAWQVPRFGKGNLIAADGKLFISTMKGELVVAQASPKEYIELGRAEILGSTRQAPALADGLLYLRDDAEIVCLDVRKK
jgi:outer membrane protein assembly factor BamB